MTVWMTLAACLATTADPDLRWTPVGAATSAAPVVVARKPTWWPKFFSRDKSAVDAKSDPKREKADNGLDFVKQEEEAPSDWMLISRCQSAVRQDRSLSGCAITVDANSGTIVLRGSVHSESAKERAERIARRTDGVQGVENLLTISSSDSLWSQNSGVTLSAPVAIGGGDISAATRQTTASRPALGAENWDSPRDVPATGPNRLANVELPVYSTSDWKPVAGTREVLASREDLPAVTTYLIRKTSDEQPGPTGSQFVPTPSAWSSPVSRSTPRMSAVGGGFSARFMPRRRAIPSMPAGEMQLDVAKAAAATSNENMRPDRMSAAVPLSPAIPAFPVVPAPSIGLAASSATSAGPRAVSWNVAPSDEPSSVPIHADGKSVREMVDDVLVGDPRAGRVSCRWDGGRVTLSGAVRTPDELYGLTARLSEVPGVAGVGFENLRIDQ